MLDELKEIEEIINRLDSINSEDWNRREDETEEELTRILDAYRLNYRSHKYKSEEFL